MLAGVHPVLLRKILHGEVDVLELAAWHGEVPWLAGADGQASCVEHLPDVSCGDILSDRDAGLEFDAFGAELIEPAIDDPLFELEIGYAQGQDAADLIGPFEDGGYPLQFQMN